MTEESRRYNPSKLEVGSTVTRMLAGTIPHKLTVHSIENGRVQCGWWTFDLETGAEIDEDLDWGPPPKMTGSFLTMEEE